MVDFSWIALAALNFCLSLGLVWLNRNIKMRRNDTIAVQAMHLHPTSRLGGMSIFLTVAIYLLYDQTHSGSRLLQNFLCALPLILFTASEDVGLRVEPRWRLLAAAASSILFITLSGAVIDRAGFSLIDFILSFQAIAVLITIFAITGATHSFNLLDGLHGLCGLNFVVIGLALLVISAQGDHEHLGQSLIPMLAALAGFLLLNFPRGILFLGDVGATGLGFILSCTAIEMLTLQTELSPWSLLLVFFWPIADTLYTIARRLTRRRPTSGPDRMHFHHVAMRSFEILVLRKKDRALSNPIATMILLPFMVCPSLAGVLLANHNEIAFAATVFFAFIFIASYQVTVLCSKTRRNFRFLNGNPARLKASTHNEPL